MPRYDGIVSRHLNRRISDPLALLLARTPVTPNQATLGAAAIGVLSFVAFMLGHGIAGGLLAQASSIADGVDGELARLKDRVSSFGGFLDAVLDRYVDALILLGMTVWSVQYQTYPGTWIVGFLAVTGALCVSYTRARVTDFGGSPFDRGLTSLASRDVRLFLVMLAGLSGQVYGSLVALAALTNLMVAGRLVAVYIRTRHAKAAQLETHRASDVVQ